LNKFPPEVAAWANTLLGLVIEGTLEYQFVKVVNSSAKVDIMGTYSGEYTSITFWGSPPTTA